MDQIEDFGDDRLKSWCIHCGGWLVDLEANEDHVPSRCLLRKPYPPQLPKVQVCARCNESFSRDEEYFAGFLGSVLAGSTEPDRQPNPTAARILTRSPKLRARIEAAKREHETRGGERLCLWQPEAERVNRVVVKNARGHAFFEFGEPMRDDPAHVWAAPLEVMTPAERFEFESVDMGPGWPDVGSRMMTRLLTGQDLQDGWVIVQDGIYRYAVMQQGGGALVRSVLSEYLATEVFWAE